MDASIKKQIIDKNCLRILVRCDILPKAKINHALPIPGMVPVRRSPREQRYAEEKPKGEKS